MKACGDELVTVFDDIDIVVTWNAYGTKLRQAQKLKKQGALHVVMESGQLPGYWYMGFDGFNGRGRWPVPGDGMVERWWDFGTQIEPMREGSHILVCGQRGGKYSDMSMPVTWPDDVIGRLRKLTDRPIIYRLHPARARLLKKSYKDVITSDPKNMTLERDLTDAHAVVVYTSSVATQAWLKGIQCFYEGPTCMSAMMSDPDINNIEARICGTNRQGKDERFQFFPLLAWCHWRPEEVENGTAWRWLTREEI